MKKLFQNKSGRKNLSDFKKQTVDSRQSSELLGGFREYKPTIYERHDSKDKIKSTNLLSGTEGNL